MSRSLTPALIILAGLLAVLVLSGVSSVSADDGTTMPTPHTDVQRAQEVLDELAAKHHYLDGVTVSLGATPAGHEAVSYYTDGEILISTSHTVDIETILAHEIWHVIDWRDNGRLDWGEALPPANAATYYR